MNVDLDSDEYSDSDLKNLEQLYMKALRKKLVGNLNITDPVEKQPVEKQPTPKLKTSGKTKKEEYQKITPIEVTAPNKTRGRPKKVQETPPPIPTVIAPLADNTPKTLQNYNKEYYAQKKTEIAKKKLLKRIEKGETVSEKLLQKYNLHPRGTE